MTQFPGGLDADQLDSPGPGGRGPDRTAPHPGTGRAGNGYLRLLRLPGAARFCASGMVGRAPMAMFGLGTVLLVAARTGRYGLAGLVAAVGSIGYAASSPQIARLADRFGQCRTLRPLAAVFGSACAVFIACAELGAPDWLLMISGGLAGASMPSLGSMVRARWSALLESQADLHAAFALESVLDEMIFVAGPAVVTLLASAFPPAGVLLAMAASVSGTLIFASQRRTEPAPRPRGDQAGGSGGRLPAAGLVTMAPVCLFIGAMFASVDLSTVAFAQRQGHRPLAGLILGTYALGSAVGGLWYGSRTWRAPAHRRFAPTLALTVAGVATFWAAPNLLALDAAVLFAGLAISPTLMTGYGLIEGQALAGRRTEAMSWLSSTISIGVAVGSALSGRIIDTAGPRWGYGFSAGCGTMAVAIYLVGLRRLRATPDAEAAQWVNA